MLWRRVLVQKHELHSTFVDCRDFPYEIFPEEKACALRSEMYIKKKNPAMAE